MAYRNFNFGVWDLAPWPGIKPCPPALGVQSLSHWTTREVPELLPVSSCLCCLHQPGWWLSLLLNCKGFICVSVPWQLFEARNMSHHLSGPRTKHGNFQAYLRVDFFFSKDSLLSELPAMREIQIWSWGWGDPLDKRMATHVFLPGEIHGQKSLVHGFEKNQTQLSN